MTTTEQTIHDVRAMTAALEDVRQSMAALTGPLQAMQDDADVLARVLANQPNDQVQIARVVQAAVRYIRTYHTAGFGDTATLNEARTALDAAVRVLTNDE
jgi:hypothetical protein